uniref:C2H2-type domain-containing protein n=1 Tax=Caenorhabditis tropicalis TaxID=1561998 RepID=A0A1I7TEN8_9PELO
MNSERNNVIQTLQKKMSETDSTRVRDDRRKIATTHGNGDYGSSLNAERSTQIRQQLPSKTLEQALMKSIDLMSTQTAIFAPIAQSAIHMNMTMIKMHEEIRSELVKSRQEHRAERMQADEQNKIFMSSILEQFGKVVDSFPKMQHSSTGKSDSSIGISTRPPKTSTVVPVVTRVHVSPGKPSQLKQNIETSSREVKKLKMDSTKIARRTGKPVTDEELKKLDDSGPCSSSGRRTPRRYSTVDSSENFIEKLFRYYVSIGETLVGTGEKFNAERRSFTTFKCSSCDDTRFSEKSLIKHFESEHEDELDDRKRKKAKKSSSKN